MLSRKMAIEMFFLCPTVKSYANLKKNYENISIVGEMNQSYRYQLV